MAIDFPNSPTTNQIFTVGNRSWIWDGATWNIYSNVPNRYVQDAPPSSPQSGDQWFESDTGRLFVYYDSVWVEIGNATDVAGAIQPSQITSLSAVTSLTSDDVFAVVDNPSGATATSKITYSNLVTAISNSLSAGLTLITSGITTNAGNSVNNGVITVGSAVSSVEIYGAFSSSYDNYKITYTDGAASTWATFNCQFGIGTSWTANNYYGGAGFFNVGGGTWQLAITNGGASFIGGTGVTDFVNLCLEIQSPNLAKRTHANGPYNRLDNGQVGLVYFEQASTTQFTSFKFTPSAGTLTGGKVRVYGYRNS